MIFRSKYHLGALCKRNHQYQLQLVSLRYKLGGLCVECQRFHGQTGKYKAKKKLRESSVEYKQRKREYDLNYSTQPDNVQRRKSQRSTAEYKQYDCDRYRRKRAQKKKVHSYPYSREEWDNRILEFDNCCAYCSISSASLTIDHFLPLSFGGSDCLGNLVPACFSCNASKQTQDPKAWFEMQPFYAKSRWKKILNVLGKDEATVNQIPLF